MKNSRVWSHFNIVSKTKSECIHCRKIISKHGGTSNLIKHLSRMHQEFCANLELRTTTKISLENHSLFQDDEKMKSLINMIQMNPVLYKKDTEKELSEYEKQSCSSIWEEIAQEFQVNENECRKIWTTIRKQYTIYFKTKNPEKCKFINELSFLNEYLQKSNIEKIPMKSHRNDTLESNCDIDEETKKVLISVPEISDVPIHEINVGKTEYIENDDENNDVEDDDNSTQDYEILYEDYDPILVKNQNYDEIDEYNSSENNETILPNEYDNQSNKPININRRFGQVNKQYQQQIRNDYRNESNRNCAKLDDKHSNYRTHNKPKTLNNNCSPTKRIKKSTDDMDEIDFFFEFLQRKLRKISPDLCRQLQVKFMETIQEAELRSRKRVDRSVDTSDHFE